MEKLRKAFEQLNIEYKEKTIDTFSKYMECILQWNDKVNLTAIKDREEFVVKHFIDSILCFDQPEVKMAKNVIDVGTGAGFPGIPLAILYPDKEFLLMDSLNKRLKIIDEIAVSLGITNIHTIHGRAEEIARTKEHREKYDLCVSRAVANLSTLAEYCLPYIREGGYFLAYKGPDCEKEIDESKRAIFLLGGKVKNVRDANLSDFDLEHKIIYIEKIKKTPSKYPRKPGTPSKEPLK